MAEQMNSEICVRLDDPSGKEAGVEIHLVSFTQDGSELYGLYAQHEGQTEGALIAHFIPDVPYEVALATLMSINGGNIVGITQRAAEYIAPNTDKQEG